MPLKKIKLEVIDILGDGKCPRGHQIGDKFNYPEDCTQICQSALHSLYPTIQVLTTGGSYPWFSEDKPDEWSRCCSDPKRPVVFKIERIEK